MSGTTNKKLEAALDYAKRGFRVIPLHHPTPHGCTCGISGCHAVAKHPRIRNWVEKATTDSEQIRLWWGQWPDANIGIATGRGSRIFVLDVDDKRDNAGSKELQRLTECYGSLPKTLTATTGLGRHLYFQAPPQSVKSNAGQLAEGLDVRGEGGYVVAPPSVHANGHTYEWVDTANEPVPAPSWLLELVTVETVAEPGEGDGEETGVIAEGTRNNTLFKIACGLFQEEMIEEDVLRIVLQYNEFRCKPPLAVPEVERLVESASTYDQSPKKKSSKSSRKDSPIYWFQFNVENFLTDTEIMSMTDYQLGWHMKFLAYSWKKGGVLPDNPKTLAALAGATSFRKFQNELDKALCGFEKLTLGGKPVLRHRKFAELYAEALEKWIQKKEAGSRRHQLTAVSAQASGFQVEQARTVN